MFAKVWACGHGVVSDAKVGVSLDGVGGTSDDWVQSSWSLPCRNRVRRLETVAFGSLGSWGDGGRNVMESRMMAMDQKGEAECSHGGRSVESG